jgi:TonB family protein
MKIIHRALLPFFLLLAIASTEKVLATTNKVFVFRGKIQAVDAATRTFKLQAERKTYVFLVTDQTKMARQGMELGLTNLRRGEDAEVEMKVGPDGKGVALSVNLVSPVTAIAESLVAATTPNGKTLSEEQIKPLILQGGYPAGMDAHIKWHLRLGVFLLAVRSDGTVANVEKLQSTGHPGLDSELLKTFMKWRFRPNSVTSVRLPAQYAVTRR